MLLVSTFQWRPFGAGPVIGVILPEQGKFSSSQVSSVATTQLLKWPKEKQTNTQKNNSMILNPAQNSEYVPFTWQNTVSVLNKLKEKKIFYKYSNVNFVRF